MGSKTSLIEYPRIVADFHQGQVKPGTGTRSQDRYDGIGFLLMKSRLINSFVDQE